MSRKDYKGHQPVREKLAIMWLWSLQKGQVCHLVPLGGGKCWIDNTKLKIKNNQIEEGADAEGDNSQLGTRGRARHRQCECFCAFNTRVCRYNEDSGFKANLGQL